MAIISYTIKMLILDLPAAVLFKVALFGVDLCSNALILLGLAIARVLFLRGFELDTRL
ncbi:MAG: hypothetical protein RLZZ512_794 [Bacteroidota bacterium]|jgi:hypothetical protein